MASETYRLEALVGLREHAKDAAERYLGECNRALRDEEERQRNMEEELARMQADRENRRREYGEKAMRGELSAQAAIAANQFIKTLLEHEEAQRQAIEGQRGVVAQRREDVEAARQSLVTANQELKALEKHREKWRLARKKERLAREEDLADDLNQAGSWRHEHQ